MRLWVMACVLVSVGALSGCHKKPADAVAADAISDDPGFLGLGSKHGRFGSVGIYTPGESWPKLMADANQADPAAAQLVDDQAIIVVADSQTGEVRACGDLTGYCIGMNPWKGALVGAQIAPIRLTAHAKPFVSEPVVTARVKHTARPKLVPPVTGSSATQAATAAG